MTTVKIFAPAKINLTLHITGRRADGYHLLDSLVAFCSVGDTLTLTPAETLSLSVTGPGASSVPSDASNLVWKAAELLGGGVAITLEKHLPPSSGIGGGSTDAAATIRGMLALKGEDALAAMSAQEDETVSLADAILGLGADVPMCLNPTPLRARGIGEGIDYAPLPPLHAVLVNPGVIASTPQVYSYLTKKTNTPMAVDLPGFETSKEVIEWLADQRNDLQAPATLAAPEIKSVLTALRQTKGCGLARMSGSGATCYGIFGSEKAALAAAKSLSNTYPSWWVQIGVIGDQSAMSAPQIS